VPTALENLWAFRVSLSPLSERNQEEPARLGRFDADHEIADLGRVERPLTVPPGRIHPAHWRRRTPEEGKSTFDPGAAFLAGISHLPGNSGRSLGLPSRPLRSHASRGIYQPSSQSSNSLGKGHKAESTFATEERQRDRTSAVYLGRCQSRSALPWANASAASSGRSTSAPRQSAIWSRYCGPQLFATTLSKPSRKRSG